MKPLAILLGVLLVPALAGTVGESPNKVLPVAAQIAAQQAPAAAGNETDITASLARPSVYVDENVAFWLTIRNRGSQSMFAVTIAPTGLEGFTIVNPCWRPAPGASSCVPTDPTTANALPARPNPLANEETITSELKPGQTLAIWGQLRADRRQEKRAIYATIRWTGADGHPSQFLAVFGDLEAENWVDSLEQVWAWIQTTLKDLALPILLAVLAFVFKKWEDNREVARRAAETARDTAQRLAEQALEADRHRSEQERQQLFQTWNQMLRVSHEDATKHYMPILAAAKTVRAHVTECRASLQQARPAPSVVPAEDKYKHALFYLVLLRKRNKRFTDRRGGFYFKDRVGEDLAAACWSETNRLYIRGDPAIREKFSELLQYVEADDLLITFMEKFRKAGAGSVYEFVHKHFCDWLTIPQCEEAMQYLESFTAIVEFEMNKPYAYWYPPEQKPKLNTQGSVDNILRKLAGDAKRNAQNKNWQSDVEAYLGRSS